MALFKINGSSVKKITAKDLDFEKNLQGIFENNLEEILNIIFLAHEYSTGWGGRMDTLGIDKNGSPCIIEYKKNQNDREKAERLQKTYSVDDHLKKSDEKIKSLFLKLREKIITLDENIKEESKKRYIAYKLATNFVDVEVRSRDIKIFLNVKSGQLNDPKNLARDLTKPKHVGHLGNGDYEVKLKNENEIDSIFELIKQSYDLNK